MVNKVLTQWQLAEGRLFNDSIEEYRMNMRQRQRKTSAIRNTTAFQSGVALFEPVTLQALSAQESIAIQSVRRTDSGAKWSSDRSIISGEIYHSLSYRKSGRSNSSIVKTYDQGRKATYYGTVLKYVAIDGTAFALLRRYHYHQDINICKHGASPADTPPLRQLVQDGVWGADYLAVSHIDDVVAIACHYIICKCIFIKSDVIPGISGF
jgi:hypothetical protein